MLNPITTLLNNVVTSVIGKDSMRITKNIKKRTQIQGLGRSLLFLHNKLSLQN